MESVTLFQIGRRAEEEANTLLRTYFDKVEWTSEHIVSAPFDFKCTKNGREYLIDVKYTTMGIIPIRKAKIDRLLYESNFYFFIKCYKTWYIASLCDLLRMKSFRVCQLSAQKPNESYRKYRREYQLAYYHRNREKCREYMARYKAKHGQRCELGRIRYVPTIRWSNGEIITLPTFLRVGRQDLRKVIVAAIKAHDATLILRYFQLSAEDIEGVKALSIDKHGRIILERADDSGEEEIEKEEK